MSLSFLTIASQLLAGLGSARPGAWRQTPRGSERVRLSGRVVHARTPTELCQPRQRNHRSGRRLRARTSPVKGGKAALPKPTQTAHYDNERFAKGGNLVAAKWSVNVPEVIIRVFFHKVKPSVVSHCSKVIYGISVKLLMVLKSKPNPNPSTANFDL